MLQEAKKVMPVPSKVNVSPAIEEKSTLVSEEPQHYASKIVSGNSFSCTDAIVARSDG